MPFFTRPSRVFTLCLPVALGLACSLTWSLPAAAQSNPSQQKAATARPTQPYGQRPDAQAWAQDVAQRRGIDPIWLQQQLAQARFLPQVPRLMTPARKSASTAPDWASYRSRMVEPIRIRAGVRFWNEHADTLARAQAIYGVPASIIVGILGVETLYGRHMGNLRVLDSLSTLAFDFPSAHPRAAQRQAYFQGELEQFLSSAWHSGDDPTRPLGSYAGAMGLGQFMPSSLEKWAVDFDGDGQINLFDSVADAIGSVAHYFQGHGWTSGLPVLYTPLFSASSLDLPTLLAPDIRPTFTAAELVAHGVIPQGGMQHPGLLALVELKNGSRPPSYIVGTQNFYVITRYNWSSYYALAVYDLGQEIAAARTGAQPELAQPVTAPETDLQPAPDSTPAVAADPS